ncbi:hypothetical protein PIB30_051770 [Stylosanthes scabra]|uniref:Uncharacterized protein n=1 Tax=Stylosanthes scabra TaxID=79078 RepID=A0ABU6XG67_9FABA|nr:hypothetical protein [Stylosanthes scabra]
MAQQQQKKVVVAAKCDCDGSVPQSKMKWKNNIATVIPAPRKSVKRMMLESMLKWLFSASRPDLVGIGASSNPSPQTPIHSSSNSQYSEFANSRGLDAIDLNDDEFENQRQEGTPH